MKTCPYCAHVNREGELFCEECGHPFAGKQAANTTQLAQDDGEGLHGRVTWGTARFDPSASLVVHVQNHLQPVVLLPSEEILLGRSEDDLPALEGGFDLNPYGGAECGVSRRHALIRRGEDTLTLLDLGSTNGTYLNGQRLIPKQPRVLRDGDEIRLGKLALHVFFK